jgi:hypothetical protein
MPSCLAGATVQTCPPLLVIQECAALEEMAEQLGQKAVLCKGLREPSPKGKSLLDDG